MTKKKKGIIIALVAVLVIAAVGCGIYFGLVKNDKDTSAPAKIESGEIYRTKTESFWVGVGKAYISFQHKEEPAQKSADDKNLYGDVFYIMVSSGEDFQPWLSGYWNLDEVEGKLMMKASWDDSAENVTKLADAKSGEEKIYAAQNGEYKIPVELPSATVTFTLNPETDKVGDANTSTADNLADAAKNDDSKTNTDENSGNLFARLTAEDTLFGGDVKGYAQIDMSKDKTWSMKVKVDPYVPDYTQAVTGTWSENSDGSLTLKVTGGDYKGALDNTINLTKSSDGSYSGSVKFNADKTNGIVFNFKFKSIDLNTNPAASSSKSSNTSSSSSKSTSVKTVKGELYRTPVFNGIYSGVVGDTYISFLGDGNFEIYVDTGEGYSAWVSGNWSLNSDQTKLTLTQKGSGDAGLTGAKAGKAKVYTANSKGVFYIDTYFPSGGTAKIEFKPSRDKVGSDNNSSNNKKDPTKPSNDNQPKDDNTTKPTDKSDIVLKAHDSIYDGAVTCDAVLTLKKDNSWNIQTTVYGSTVDNAVTGTWKENNNKSITLTVSTKIQGADLPDSFVLNYDKSTNKYTGIVKFTCNSQFTFNLKFEGSKNSQEETTVKVTGISLDKSELGLTVGSSTELTAKIAPSNANEKGVVWTSTDNSVATVNNGKVTAVSNGTAYIIAAAKDGGFTAFCKVSVVEPDASEEHLTATSNDKCNGFPMSLKFDNGAFKLNVDTTYFDASDWFKGTYSLSEDKTKLTLNIAYNANGPHFEAAEAAQTDSVVLNSENGAFKIVVKDPSASAVNGTFTLTVDALPEKPTPSEPEEPEKPAAELQLELVASDTVNIYGTDYSADAKLDLYKDNTFKILVNSGNGFEEAASGTWELDAAYNMVLAIKKQAIEKSFPETVTLNVDYSTYEYSGSVVYTPNAYVTMNFAFATKKAEPEKPAPQLQLELVASDTIDVYGTSYTADSKLDLYDDNTFKMLVDAGQGYIEAASGTWELDAAYNMVLKVKEQTIENSLPESITLNVDYSTYQYSGKVTYVASAYTTFNFAFEPKK